MPEPILEPIFVLAPRYSRDLAGSLDAAGYAVEMALRAADAQSAFSDSDARIALIDARGALASGLVVAHEIGLIAEARLGAMLVLLARSDAVAIKSVYDAGATHVLVSPFSAVELIDAVRFAGRMTERLSDAATGRVATVESDGVPRDALTGLASAQHAHDWVELLLGSCTTGDPAVIVMIVALGRFGQLNAAYGRSVADAVLVAAAARLRELVMPAGGDGDGWLVARMAGAEFAVVLPSPAEVDDGLRVAQRIVEGFAAPFAVAGRVIHLGVRAGLACGVVGAGDADDPDRLFQQASAALSVARTQDPGSIEVFSDASEGDSLTRLADLETDLRRAIDRNEFEILYQPQVDIASGCIVGAEALVRWAHPVFGELPAKTLLEVAASADFATLLGRHIRLRAVHEAAAWPPSLGKIHLSLNVNATDLRAENFAQRLESALASSGFAPDRLTVEVTESDLIENLAEASAALEMLRGRGVGIALDDFGTGYSSLAYLKSLPLDCLKLDRSLTADLAGSPRDRIIVAGIVDLAQALGLRVTAEGVETPHELDLVTDACCDWYQGFLCTAGLPSAAFVSFVEDWNSGQGSARPVAAGPKASGVEPGAGNG